MNVAEQKRFLEGKAANLLRFEFRRGPLKCAVENL